MSDSRGRSGTTDKTVACFLYKRIAIASESRTNDCKQTEKFRQTLRRHLIIWKYTLEWFDASVVSR